MARDNLYVLDGDQKVPFLRGMVTHSLIERGLSFQKAYEAASLVRDQVRKQRVIEKSQLSALINSIVAEKFGEKYARRRRRQLRQLPTIHVVGEDSVTPFSKGILSQSLQATGLEPSLTYDIARDIEAYLLTESRLQIRRHELRKLIYQTILQGHESDVAERYLLWRYLKTPDRPLLILFGGATGVGKSTVAAEVAHRLGIQKLVSTDTIRQMMRMMFSRDLLPAIHCSSYEAWKIRVERENEERRLAVIEAFKEQSLLVMVGVRAMIERAIQENSSLVIDGIHLIPGLMELEAYEANSYIVPLLISTSNRSQHLERFPGREMRQSRRLADRYLENFENIRCIQAYLLEISGQHGVPTIENDNFDETVLLILTEVTRILQEKIDLRREELISRVL